MFVRWRVLLCTLAVLSLINVKFVNARKSSGSHSYPKSGGYSGGGRHSYPSSGGYSGGSHGSHSSGGSHGYPSSGGMSGGSHGYPSSGGMSGGSHGYPSSGGISGGSQGYPSSGGMSGGTHGYPSSGGNSGGSHGYPSSGGMSGGGSGYPSSGTVHKHPSGTHSYPPTGGNPGNLSPSGSTHTTTVHHHYHYSPPQQIRYIPPSGGPAVSYPVFRGTPPTYVYQVKDSGSKYGTLLTGLALLNLGTLAGAAIAHSGSHSSSHSGSSYKPAPGERCYFGLKKDNGDYEETVINCQLISSFILQEESKPRNASNTTITTTVTNVTMVNTTNGMPAVSSSSVPSVNYTMLPNGTLVPNSPPLMNSTVNAIANANNTVTSSVTITTTTTNTTVTNALDVKGEPIAVTTGMQCFVIRTTPTSRMKKSVPCRLLQTYAETSIKRNSAARNAPAFTLLAVLIASFLIY